MGIPSYYKKLVNHIQGLRSQGHPVNEIQWLFMDFNCLIYHCLHTMPAYSHDNKDAWENSLIEAVVSYCLLVIKQVQPKKGVYIAIDGVVPMAKMKQQRLRRFKSVWLSQNDPTIGSKWDTNAITPGTAFMGKLRVGLESMIEKHGKVSWQLSSSDEPGEGEHKIMAEWRKGTYKGDFVVYGLDADLIVLSMLGQASNSLHNKIWLFREDVAAAKDEFEWFSIDLLREWITSSAKTDADKHKFILNYCFAMSILGNDFLPSSLGLKIREDGHSELMYLLQTMLSRQLCLVDPTTMSISFQGVRTLFTLLTTNEEVRIAGYISKKQMFARQLGTGIVEVGDNNWPLYHVEEEILLESKKQMASSWKETYLTYFFPGFSYNKNTIGTLCKEYLYGMQWIWAYYTGGDVCYNWYYPHSLPPLWEWLRDVTHELQELPSLSVSIRAHDIKTVEQLSIVLPLESWSLIPPCLEKQLPLLAPHFFPASFSFESVGKRFFWECESQIPLPSIMELKKIMQTH